MVRLAQCPARLNLRLESGGGYRSGANSDTVPSSPTRSARIPLATSERTLWCPWHLAADALRQSRPLVQRRLRNVCKGRVCLPWVFAGYMDCTAAPSAFSSAILGPVIGGGLALIKGLQVSASALFSELP
jgi:hypothetical protein